MESWGNQNMEFRNLWICDTPFQVMNCLNYVYHNQNTNIKNHLCIVKQFKNAKLLADQISSKSLFDRIYLLEADKRGENESSMHWYMWRIFAYLFPQKEIEKCMGTSMEKLTGYNCIWSSVVTCFVAAVLQENEGAEFKLFDDGTGSYAGNIIENSVGWKHRLFSKVFKRGSNVISPTVLYVNNPSYCSSTVARKVEGLPQWDEDYLKFANSIFGYDDKKDKQSIIVLTQPDDLREGKRRFDVLERLLKYKKEVLIRPHPRDLKRYENFAVDTSECLWEIKIANIDIENKILISDFSTAQITPKMIFDKEPILVFTIYLSHGEDYILHSEIPKMIERVRDTYRDKKRVITPKTFEEFENIIQILIDNQ